MATRHIGSEITTRTFINKLFLKLLSLGFLLIIALVFLLSILLTYSLIIAPDGPNTLGGLRVLTVVGDSMNPSLDNSDLIIVKRTSLEDIRKGDIVSFRRDSTIITHRVFKILDNQIITRGDNNSSNDDISVSSDDLLGKVMFVIPKGDYILSLSRNPFFTFIFFLLLLLNISVLFRVIYK